MPSLTSTLQDFHSLIPSQKTREKADKEAKAWEERERKRQIAKRIRESGIPAEFLDADIERCDHRVKQWCLEALKGSKRNLLIQGKVGRGKSYSASAALLFLAQEKRIKFATYDEVLGQIKATYTNAESEQDVISRYSSVAFLCLDDFGKTKPTEWNMANLFQIVNNRYNNGKPTIYTTQYTGKELMNRLVIPGDDEYAKAIISRMGNFEHVVIEGKDRRLS